MCIGMLFLLAFNKETRFASFVFLASFFVYWLFVLDLSGEYYYSAAALVELARGYALNKRYRVVAYLAYSLILINFFGWVLYESGEDPIVYDIICAIVLITQIMLLTLRGLLNGDYQPPGNVHNDNPLVRVIDFDSRDSRVRMYKNPQAKKTNR